MDTSRRAFVHMGLAAAAVAGTSRLGLAASDPMKEPFSRFWIAAVTPVDRQGNFDNAVNDAMLAWWKAQGADGVLLLGTTGEATSFSVAERKGLMSAYREAGMPMDRLKEVGIQAYDEPQAFADAIIQALQSEHEAQALSRAAYDNVFSVRASSASRDEALRAATASRQPMPLLRRLTDRAMRILEGYKCHPRAGRS